VSKWTVRDRYGNEIYMTQERWEHILGSRPDLEDHLDEFLETLRTGRRRQDPLVPNKYFYYNHLSVAKICGKVVATSAAWND